MSQSQRVRQDVPLTVVASHIGPAVTPQTLSLLPTGGRALQHGFLLIEGTAVAELADDTEIELDAPALVWIPANLGRQVRLGAGGTAIAVSCSESLIWRTMGESSMAIDLRTILDQVVIARADAFPVEEVTTCFEAIERELRQLSAGGMSIVSFALGMALVHMWRATAPEHPARALPGGSEGLVQRYRQLVELHFRDRVSVKGYADLLGVTRARLTDACIRVAGMAPQAMLHIRLSDEARHLLDRSGLSVEQVAYSLGFRDPAYFNRFFTRLVGVTPGEFKKTAREAKHAQIQSFAAWP